MIGDYVTRSRIMHITPAQGVPGLFDLWFESGEVIYDLTVRQTQAFINRNGLVARGGT